MPRAKVLTCYADSLQIHWLVVLFIELLSGVNMNLLVVGLVFKWSTLCQAAEGSLFCIGISMGEAADVLCRPRGCYCWQQEDSLWAEQRPRSPEEGVSAAIIQHTLFCLLSPLLPVAVFLMPQ